MALKLSSIYGSGVPKPTELLPPLTAGISGATNDADTERVIFDLTGKFEISYLGRNEFDNNQFARITKVELDGAEIFSGSDSEVIGHLFVRFNTSSPYQATSFSTTSESLRCNESFKVWAKSSLATKSSSYLLIASAIE